MKPPCLHIITKPKCLHIITKPSFMYIITKPLCPRVFTKPPSLGGTNYLISGPLFLFNPSLLVQAVIQLPMFSNLTNTNSNYKHFSINTSLSS